MRILVTGITGFVGSALAPVLLEEGHELRALSRRAGVRAPGDIEVFQGDAVSGDGLDAAMRGVEVAYYLIHSMESGSGDDFEAREQQSADNFAAAAERAGVRRVVYLGGPVPETTDISPHLRSRLGVEQRLLATTPEAIAFRASIVIGANSRSFRFLVRLIERMPVLVLPAWRGNRTAPIDERDVIAYLAAAATIEDPGRRSIDLGGLEVVSYQHLIERIRDHLIVLRPTFGLPVLTLTPIASRVAAVIAGEDPEFIRALMGSLDSDLLVRNDDAQHIFNVRLHTLDSAVEYSLRRWEAHEPLAAR